MNNREKEKMDRLKEREEKERQEREEKERQKRQVNRHFEESLRMAEQKVCGEGGGGGGYWY